MTYDRKCVVLGLQLASPPGFTMEATWLLVRTMTSSWLNWRLTWGKASSLSDCSSSCYRFESLNPTRWQMNVRLWPSRMLLLAPPCRIACRRPPPPNWLIPILWKSGSVFRCGSWSLSTRGTLLKGSDSPSQMLPSGWATMWADLQWCWGN